MLTIVRVIINSISLCFCAFSLLLFVLVLKSSRGVDVFGFKLFVNFDTIVYYCQYR